MLFINTGEYAFDDLIDVIDIVKKDIPNIKLNLVGDGKLKNDLTNKIDKLGLNDNINLCGFLSQTEIKKIMLNQRGTYYCPNCQKRRY